VHAGVMPELCEEYEETPDVIPTIEQCNGLSEGELKK
jgi:hypothetical protein